MALFDTADRRELQALVQCKSDGVLVAQVARELSATHAAMETEGDTQQLLRLQGQAHALRLFLNAVADSATVLARVESRPRR